MTRLDLADVQGNILRGYRASRVRHVLVHVADRGAARAWLASVAVTTAEDWGPTKPATCLNVGVTFAGLQALGVPDRSLDTFPHEFAAGMPARSVKLGDVGRSDPSRWMAPLADPTAVHLMMTVYADDEAVLETKVRDELGAAGRGFRVVAALDGAKYEGETVHFGYRDSIAQPRFAGVHDPDEAPDRQPLAPLGVALLGHPSAFEGVRFEEPRPAVLGQNGSFDAFRVLAQDVMGFHDFLERSAEQLERHPGAHVLLDDGEVDRWGSARMALRELVAAKVLGRWRNGVPLARSPGRASPEPAIPDNELNDFGYATDDDGARCPIGSHIRRANPRDARIVQRSAGHTRRIVRRGMPYGLPFDTDDSSTHGEERGLLGNFLCASLIAQFEALQYDWLNLGLQDPRITGTNDPLVGANDETFSRFSFPAGEGVVHLEGLPRFVTTRGGAYLFLPTVPALRHLGSLSG